MPDPIQSSSSIPLPTYQTGAATRDPVPYGGTEDIARQDAQASHTKDDASTDQFRAYLDQSAVLVIEAKQKEARSLEFDASKDIENSSAYKQNRTTSGI